VVHLKGAVPDVYIEDGGSMYSVFNLCVMCSSFDG
jgi:hypothetical protein